MRDFVSSIVPSSSPGAVTVLGDGIALIVRTMTLLGTIHDRITSEASVYLSVHIYSDGRVLIHSGGAARTHSPFGLRNLPFGIPRRTRDVHIF